MSLRDAIKKATSQIVPNILQEMAGSTVDTTRQFIGSDDAARVTRDPANPILAGEWFIVEITDAHRQRVWGVDSGAIAEAHLPFDTDVIAGDIVHVIAGDFVGKTWEVENINSDPIATYMGVALGPTGKRPSIPPGH